MPNQCFDPIRWKTMEFTYTAIDAGGTTVANRIEAENEEKAIRLLQAQGLVLIGLESGAKEQSARKQQGRSSGLFRSRRVKFDQVVAFTRELALLIESGIPILEAVESLAEYAENETIKQALYTVRTDLNEGKGLAEAMSAHPYLFPPIYITLVRTAELSGNLDETLNYAAEFQEAALDMRRKVKAALTYPAILFAVMVKVVIFMLVYIIPQFQQLFIKAGANMPLQTRIMLAAGLFLKQNWWVIPIGLILIPLGLRAFLRTPAGKESLARLTQRLPVIHDLAAKIVCARLLRTLGTLLRSGISMPTALEMAAESAINPIYTRGLLTIRTKVEEGRPLAVAMQEVGIFPPLVCQTISVGEKSGRLSQLALRVSQFYEQETDGRLKMLSSILEPVMIMLLGLIVGFMAVSILSPIYSLMDTIK
jgi:type IV pilus assembly protein PilC